MTNAGQTNTSAIARNFLAQARVGRIIRQRLKLRRARPGTASPFCPYCSASWVRAVRFLASATWRRRSRLLMASDAWRASWTWQTQWLRRLFRSHEHTRENFILALTVLFRTDPGISRIYWLERLFAGGPQPSETGSEGWDQAKATLEKLEEGLRNLPRSAENSNSISPTTQSLSDSNGSKCSVALERLVPP